MTSISKPLERAAPRFFYGWLIVLIACLGMFITAGTGGYIFGQLIRPLSQAFGWSVGLVSSATLVRSLTSILVVPVVGRITDRVGSRPVMLAGSLIGGGAFMWLSVITDPLLFYAVFTVVVSVGYSMLGGIPSQAAVARWFKRRRGMALSLVTMGISFGGVVMVPLVQYLLDNFGWRFAFGAIGAGIWPGPLKSLLTSRKKDLPRLN
ncbi:MAG: MFS transporter [Chloroflexi bacterium]|nr:MFS transporter [Chloroflexota bacterium]